MKNELFIILISLGIAKFGDAQANFSLSGNISKEFEYSVVKLFSQDSTFSTLYDTVANGSFSFSGTLIQEFNCVYLSFSKGSSSITTGPFFLAARKMSLSLFCRDNEPCQIHYTNIPFVDEQAEYTKAIKNIDDSLGQTYDLIFQVKKNLRKGFSIDSLDKKYNDLKTKRKLFLLKFLRSHKDSYYALFVFKEQVLDFAFDFEDDRPVLPEIYSGFSEVLKTTSLGIFINQQLAKRESVLLGKQFPDFSFHSETLLPYTLSEFKNKKYVLLCFWASWCRPCIEGIPTFSKLAAEHKNQELQIVYLSIDEEEEKWRRIVKETSPPGLQTCDIYPFVCSNKMLRNLLDIQYIPQYFLIDKTGKIIYHNRLCNDDEKYTILSNLLKQLLNPEQQQ